MDKCTYITTHFRTPSHMFLHMFPRAEGIGSLSIELNMDPNTSLLLLLTLSHTQWSRELRNSLLFIAHCLTYTNINAPFCASCALVSLSGVAKVITALCLLPSPLVNVEECITLWAQAGEGDSIEAVTSIPITLQPSSFLRELV